MKSKLFVAIFTLFLAVLTVANIFAPKKEFSDNENRTLAKFPTLSAETLKDDTFTKGFAEYIADHFALRDVWVSIKSFAEQALLKKENNSVYKCGGGMLIDSFDESSCACFEDNINAVNEFEAMMRERGVDTKTLIAPCATLVYKDKLPAFAETADFDYLYESLKTRVPSFVDVFETLEAHKDEYIFYSTDHHWTDLGAYYAYSQYKLALGENAAAHEDYAPETVSKEFYGTLYSRYGQFIGISPDVVSAPKAQTLGQMQVTASDGTVTDSIYRPEKLSEKDKYLYFLGGNDSIVMVKTQNSTGRRLLLIKDSYANSMTPYLVGDFDEIYIVDMRYYMWLLPSLVDEKGVTDVLILYNLKSFAEEKTIATITLTQ